MIVSRSSDPLPTRIDSGGTPSTLPAACRNESPSGSGYLRSLSPVRAARIASNTRGDGGYGFSLVLSLTYSPSRGCSPGTYPAIARMFGRTDIRSLLHLGRRRGRLLGRAELQRLVRHPGRHARGVAGQPLLSRHRDHVVGDLPEP